ncbi:hypothetical protein JJJ17_09605 [Paracoccus caeni]|uniref:Uncharacterized protein n=1 Tax=Paracoccus caeni TaxID=657651 RepID=A0A934W0W1_9RHOB|nr:hypothetical protein [Paracoccus caeni]MBK4216179.1 hypothetical protein [Paracoccus caeni]
MRQLNSNSCIELFDLDAQIPMQGKAAGEGQAVATWALAHLCLMVSDLEAATDSIIAAGARQLSGPETLHLGLPAVTVHNAIFEGVAGEIIELIEKVSFPGDSPGTSTFPVSPRIVK